MSDLREQVKGPRNRWPRRDGGVLPVSRPLGRVSNGLAGRGQGWRLALRGLWAVLTVLGLVLLWPSPTGGASGRHVEVLPARGVINPIMAGYIQRGIERGQANGAEAVIIQLDTPGGLDTSMREIIQATLNADVPVVVYVSPPGGRAASAGLFITMAAHVAAMAPNTNIGSAHPVSIGGGIGGQAQPTPDKTMTDKVTNDAVALIRGLAQRRGRNVEWAEAAVRESVNVPETEALRLGVVDLVADDLPSLLEQIDGREVTLARTGRTLHTRGATAQVVELGFLERFLHLISDPNIAYILLTIGIYGLIYELASPGSILPGVVGVLALIMAFFSLGMLPVNYAGLALILFGFALMVADVLLMPGAGALAAGGVLSLLLGSLLLLSGAPPYFSLSLWIIGTVVATTSGFVLILVRGVARSHSRPPSTGVPALVGSAGEARTDLRPEGMVFVQGELWRARVKDGHLAKGARVEVVAVDGLTLVVRKAL